MNGFGTDGGVGTVVGLRSDGEVGTVVGLRSSSSLLSWLSESRCGSNSGSSKGRRGDCSDRSSV